MVRLSEMRLDGLAAVGLTEETAWPLAEAAWHSIGAEAKAYHRALETSGAIYAWEDDIWWAEKEFGPLGGNKRGLY
jgi:hypothetical protein